MTILDGKKIRDDILEKIKREVSALSFQPVFCDVLVGDDSASKQYVQMKGRTAETVGIAFHTANFPSSIKTDELIEEIKVLNKMPNMCGIIIQLPLPEHIDRQAVLDAIDPKLDVDCLGTVASQKFYNNYDNKNDLAFPTALACVAVLDSLNLNLNNPPRLGEAGRKIVVLGQGMLVGKPVTALLRSRNLAPVSIDSKTENKEELIKDADIIISGMGKGKYIIGNMIKNGAILIDAGTFETEGGIVGDVDLESVKDIAGYVSPVPGGVGPVTVAMLLNNVLTVAKSK
ncbi:MAG: bifunctional 5,10-methylenetetrahydrofolate dehydrogenase/5,10-methenyltetrahydrofolate cyclohydrolase [Candidatus Paceibacterota bacterium]|jgi:methylenetetrahydrofolate dehydrogenase (NADP+)/methenyltetrahydrofolate cyclohydrolase